MPLPVVTEPETAYLRRKYTWRLVHGGLQRLKWYFSQALQSVRRTRATRLRHELVVVTLTAGNIADRNGRARLHERPAEEAFGVSSVRQHVERNGYRAGALAPSGRTISNMYLCADEHTEGRAYVHGHLGWVSPECADILLNPAKRETFCRIEG